MKHPKIIILPFLFLTVLCLGQTKEKSQLVSLYNNFPIDSSLKFIADYCKAKSYSTQTNIYDKTKTDYSNKLENTTFFEYKPTSVTISSAYAYKYALGDTIPDETLIAFLTISYQDTVADNAEKQYKNLLKIFRKTYRHSNKTYLVSEHGREGEMVKFYLDKYLKLPVLTIELQYTKDNSLWKGRSIFIAYVRPYPSTGSN